MNTGGPAFPVPVDGATDGRTHDAGMTLLDWYAGQALAGLMASQIGGGPDDSYANSSYDLASAMLAEKARREATGKDSLQVPDHSPDAGKMAEIQAANRELVEALEKVLDCIQETRGPSAYSAVNDARAILAKHKGAA